MSSFSRRSAYDATPNELARALEERRRSGAPILDLTESNPTRAGIAYDARAILDALATPAAMLYEPEPLGLPCAREAVAREAGVDPWRVALTASTSEAYALLFSLYADAGDEILAPAPSYPLFSQLAALADVRLVPYRLRYDGAWHVDAASARAALSPRTRAILVVSPNNPTGSRLAREELAALEALGLPVICDEVFASYVLRERPGRVVCAAEDATGPAWSLGGLSKQAALPQMKLAWLIAGGPEAKARAALERLAWIADAYLSVATPVQHALPTLLDAGRAPRAAIAARTRRNLDALDRAVAGTPATRLDVEAGWYATLRVPRVRSEMETCLRALERGVYVHPGSFFGFEDEAYLVVSLLTREAALDEGVARLIDVVR